MASPLPAPTALRKLPVKLSKSAITGIVLGSVIVVAAISELCLWLCLRRNKKRRVNREKAAVEQNQRELEKVRKEEERRREEVWPMVDSNPRYEIEGKGGRGEMDAGLVNELEGSGIPALEELRREAYA